MPVGSDDSGLSANEDRCFHEVAANFSGLHELIVQDPTFVEKLRELTSENRGSCCSHDGLVDGVACSRKTFAEIDRLVKMAEVVQQAAVSLSGHSSRQVVAVKEKVHTERGIPSALNGTPPENRRQTRLNCKFSPKRCGYPGYSFAVFFFVVDVITMARSPLCAVKQGAGHRNSAEGAGSGTGLLPRGISFHIERRHVSRVHCRQRHRQRHGGDQQDRRNGHGRYTSAVYFWG